MTYYYISDERAVGKKDDEGNTYLYDDVRGWVKVFNRVITDYEYGYDPSEPPGSPYRFGNGSILNLLSFISEEEAAQKMLASDYHYRVRKSDEL